DAGADVAWRADVSGEFGMDPAKLSDFVHRGGIDFFLGVEACAHGPFVEKMKERTGFDKADRFCIREEIKSDFWRHAMVKELVFCGPGVMHCALVDFEGARIFSEELRRDEVWLARVGKGQKRARTGDHTVALGL